MKKLKWTTGVREVKDLLPWKENPRKISKQSLDKLKERIVQNGFHDVIVIDVDNTILSGNQRKIALTKLGVDTVNVITPNRRLTDDERRKIAIESNINDGEWDFEKLQSFDLDLLSDVGFDDNLLANIWDDDLKFVDDEFDEEKELEKIQEPTTKPGDLIILGRHKLLCGDSNNLESVKRLFEKETASVILCDPPYNIDLSYKSGLGGKQNYGAEVIDNRTEKEYIEFLRKNISNALSVIKPDCHVFYWNTEQQIWMIQNLYRELGVKNKRVCLWIKNGHNPTPQVAFNKCYEPCIYGTIGSPYISKKEQGLSEVLNKDIGNGNESLDDINIWTSRRIPKNEYKHATSKPTDLYDKPIRRCTKPGDIIYDSFGGSGSSLISAEMLNRKVYTIEEQPVFCDLIVSRYEKLTGKKVKVISKNEKA